MALTFKQWKEILETINPNKDDILEAIKEELNKQDHNTYQEWEEKNFNLDHLIKMLGNKLSLKLLYIATMNGHKDLVIALSKTGTKVDEKRVIDKCTAFIFATAYGNKDIAIALLAPGADIDEEGECDKHILLHFANKYNMCDS